MGIKELKSPVVVEMLLIYGMKKVLSVSYQIRISVRRR